MTDKILHPGTDNFFLLAGPCVIEGERMALDIAETIAPLAAELNIPYIFKGSYRPRSGPGHAPVSVPGHPALG